MLTPDERSTLLRLARASIQEALLRDGSLARALRDARITEALAEPRATFVTVRVPDESQPEGRALRGCIGTLVAAEPFHRAVIHYAEEAAFRDPRFPPLGRHELGSITIEVSALTAPRPIESSEEIVLGRDGLVLERGPFRSVFLPQVATEQGWDRTEFLEHLALKAGLGRAEWRGARLSVFQAEHFEEVEPGA